jgi:pimeloyl-ACP methyl ester carboxylesterase
MQPTEPAPLSALHQGPHAPAAPLNWLLLGPLARECAFWDGASQQLVEHLQVVQPQARLFELDLPGTGNQWREPSASHVGLLLQQLRERVQQAGLAGPFGLIASSWAGCLATEWARQHPAEVGALVLISPAMRPFTHVLRSVRPGLWSTALALLLGRRSPLDRDRRLWRSHTRLRTPSAALLQQWRDLRRAHPTRARTGIAQVLAVWRYESSRRRPHTRVLLLAGKGDEWMDWRVSAAISRAWGAALRLHPEAGHDLLLDDPQWVARSLAEWLLPVGSGGLNTVY